MGARSPSSYKPQVAEHEKQQLVLFTGSKLFFVPELLSSQPLGNSVAHGFLSGCKGVLRFLKLLDSLGNFALSPYQFFYY